MERLQRPHNRLHHLGFAGNIVGYQRGDANGIFGRRVMFAENAKNNQSSGKQYGEGNQPAAFGFEETEKVTRFHGWPLGERIGRTLGVLVMMTRGGGDDRRFTNTVNWFFKERLFRPPSDVPV